MNLRPLGYERSQAPHTNTPDRTKPKTRLALAGSTLGPFPPVLADVRGQNTDSQRLRPRAPDALRANLPHSERSGPTSRAKVGGKASLVESVIRARRRRPAEAEPPPADLGRAKRRGEQAIQAFQEANSLDARPRLSHADDVIYSAEAKRARGKAVELLEPTAPIVVSAGEAVTWESKADEIFKGSHAAIVETLEHPNSISVGASGCRMNAALAAGVLEPAVDAAVSAQAGNSIEKMLCHQLAAAHKGGMELLARVEQPLRDLPAVERARLTNAAARMFEVYQSGCLTLLRLKTRGTQRVLVQHQQVITRSNK